MAVVFVFFIPILFNPPLLLWKISSFTLLFFWKTFLMTSFLVCKLVNFYSIKENLSQLRHVQRRWTLISFQIVKTILEMLGQLYHWVVLQTFAWLSEKAPYLPYFSGSCCLPLVLFAVKFFMSVKYVSVIIAINRRSSIVIRKTSPIWRIFSSIPRSRH